MNSEKKRCVFTWDSEICIIQNHFGLDNFKWEENMVHFTSFIIWPPFLSLLQRNFHSVITLLSLYILGGSHLFENKVTKYPKCQWSEKKMFFFFCF